MKRKVIYLACPYSHEDPAVRQQRFEDVTAAANRLVADGVILYSPITSSHAIEQAGNWVKPGAFWLPFDEPFMELCEELWVLMLDGWQDSSGVTHEILHFQSRNKRVRFLVPGLEHQQFDTSL